MMCLPCRLRPLHTWCTTCCHFTSNLWRPWTFHSCNITLLFLWHWYCIIFPTITCLCCSLTSQTASYCTIDISFCCYSSPWPPFSSCTTHFYFIPAPWTFFASSLTWQCHPPHQLAALPCLCNTRHHSREGGRPATHKNRLPGRHEALQQRTPKPCPWWKSPGNTYRRKGSRGCFLSTSCPCHAPKLWAGVGKCEWHPGRAADDEQPSLHHRPSPDAAGIITGTTTGCTWNLTSLVLGSALAHSARRGWCQLGTAHGRRKGLYPNLPTWSVPVRCALWHQPCLPSGLVGFFVCLFAPCKWMHIFNK